MRSVFRIISKAIFTACFGILLSFAVGKETKASNIPTISITSNINSVAGWNNEVTPLSFELNGGSPDMASKVTVSFADWTKDTAIVQNGRFEAGTYYYYFIVSIDKNSSYTDHGSSRSIDLDGNSLSGTIQNDSNTDKYLYVGSITITAPTTFTVTFSVVNGKWVDDSTTNKTEPVANGGSLTQAQIPGVGNKPNGGYREGSWLPSTPSTSTTITENKTYTYTYAPITVTFNANGGECATASATVGSDGKLSVLPQAERVGFGFDGWFDDATDPNTAVELDKVYSGDTILTAHWTENPTTYNITVNTSGGGTASTASASATSAAAGANITLTATAGANYHFVNWTAEGVNISNATSPTGASFTMPSNAVTVTANFSQNSSTDHTITVTNDGHGTGRTDHATASCDALVQLSATPSSGWIFDRWTTEDAIDIKNPTSATDAWFRMIDSNVTVKANFKAKSNPKKDDDDDDHHEESSSHSPEKPSWTPAKAAATIAAQKAQKQQAAATQLASIQTMLRTKTSDRAGTGRNVIDLDMTNVDILDPATVNLLLLNNRFAFNVKISVPGGLTTTIMIPANFNFHPFIKADGTMNIHEVLWSIVKSRIKKATPKGSLYMIR